jgi:choline kinase
MGELTHDRPKCLTALDGKPLIERQITALRQGGCESVDLITGYRREQLVEYGDHHFVNADWASTNMVMTLFCAKDTLQREEVIVSYSDIFYSAATVETLCETTEDIAITFDPDWRALWEARFDDPLSDAETFKRDDDGRLLAIGAQTASMADIDGQFMGLIKITPTGATRVLGLISELSAAERAKIDMTALLSGLIGRGVTIGTRAVIGPWGECDDAEDIAVYERWVEEGRLHLD